MVIDTRFGPAMVQRLLDRDGVRLELRTEVHGTVELERAVIGWWTVCRDA